MVVILVKMMLIIFNRVRKRYYFLLFLGMWLLIISGKNWLSYYICEVNLY